MRHRVFIGLTETAGYFGALQAGFREIGVPATFIDESDHPYRYGSSAWYARFAAARRSARRQRQERRIVSPAGLGAAARWLCLTVLFSVFRVGLFTWAVIRHDVFIFASGQTFVLGYDMPLLRALGKTVICVFTGSDHRPPYMNGRAARDVDVHGAARLVRETQRTHRHVRRVGAGSDWVVGLYASSHFHRDRIVHFLAMGIPMTLNETAVVKDWFTGTGVRVLHCPSDPVSKGSDLIRGAIDRLRDVGREIDYVELTGRPHDEILSAIRQSDFVVDEVYSDTPIAVFAAEAAWFGKPAVVTGYYAAHLADDPSTGVIPESVFVTPAGLDEAIDALVVDGSRRVALGRSLQAFVRSQWAAAAVAMRYLTLIERGPDAAWLADPSGLRYALGSGLTEASVAGATRAMIASAGAASLLLDHNPPLRDEVVRLASTGTAVEAVGVSRAAVQTGPARLED